MGIELNSGLTGAIKPLGADINQVASTLTSANASDKAKVKAAKDFEGLLIYKLLDEVKNTIPDSGLLGGGAQTRQMQDIFWHYLADELADQGGFGMWKQIYSQIGNDHQPDRAGQNVEVLR